MKNSYQTEEVLTEISLLFSTKFNIKNDKQ